MCSRDETRPTMRHELFSAVDKRASKRGANIDGDTFEGPEFYGFPVGLAQIFEKHTKSGKAPLASLSRKNKNNFVPFEPLKSSK